MQSGIILEDGHRVALSSNEQVLTLQNNHLFSTQQDFETNTTVIRAYKINAHNIQLTTQKTFDHAEIGLDPINEEQNILLTDNIEGTGYLLEFYSSNFKLLNRYVPYPEGYSHVAFSSSLHQTAIVVLPLNTTDSPKLLLFDKNGQRTKEQALSLDLKQHRISRLYLTDNYIVAFGYNLLLVTDIQGNKLWQKEIIVPYEESEFAYNSTTQSLFTICTESDKDKLLCINMKNGQIQWESDFGNILWQKKSTGITRPNDLQVIGKNVGIIVSEFRTVDDSGTKAFKNAELYIFDDKGTLINKTPIVGEHSVLKVTDNTKTFSIISNLTISEYTQ